MEIPLLEPSEDYSSSNNTYYHGFGGTSNLEGILDHGALLSPGRREVHPDDLMKEQLYEDVLRHSGQSFTEYGFGREGAVEEYVQEHREDFLEECQEYTTWLIEDDEIPESGLPDFMGKSIVWISKERQEASNYSMPHQTSGSDGETGGYFKLKIPEECVLQFGLNGGVPGEIPLEYAEELYLQNVAEEESTHIWADFLASKYDIALNSI